MLSIEKLTVKRSETFTLDIPALAVPAKKVLCIAGPNGSGKTTLIQCLAGILAPTTGAITIDGQNVGNNLRTTRATMGYVPDDEDWFVKELSAREYFRLLEDVYREVGVGVGMTEQIERLAKALSFTTFDQQLASLSHGNKKKAQIIAALMHQPKILIVDELRNGLDPLAIIAVEQLVRAEAKRGTCIVAATHDLWWAERIAHNILLLDDGKPAVHQKTAAIVGEHGSLEALFIKTIREHAHAQAV